MIKKKKTLRIFFALTIVSILTFTFFLIFPQIEKVTDIETINPGGVTGKILVVYHPGISNFQKNVTRSFVNGLVEKDYIVDMTTPSSKTTTEIDRYDLIVLGSPTYGFSPAKPIEDYIKRVGDFNDKKVVVLLTGAGSTDESIEEMKDLIEVANGSIIEVLILWSSAPNEEIYETSDPLEIAYNSAVNLDIS